MWNKLTPRERDVCELHLKGYSKHRIASTLGLSYLYVGNIFVRIYLRLGIPHTLDQPTVLAVQLTYERYPHLRPRNGLYISTETYNPAPGRDGTRNRPIFYRRTV